MKYAISPTPQFERDYRRAAKTGLDMAPLNAVIAALAAGGPLPPENRDRPLGGELYGYRECQIRPDRLLVYRIDGDLLLLHLIRTGTRGEVYHREGGSALKQTKALRTLIRSPLKTAVTLLLLAAAAFLFLYNLGEYAVSDREYREARDKYHGVLTVEEQAVPVNTSIYDFFLLTDETGRTETYGEKIWESDPALTYENNHQLSLGADILERLSALPHVSRVENRYLTAGVSPDYIRMDTDERFFAYNARCVLTATVKYRYPTFIDNTLDRIEPYEDKIEYVTLEDAEILAGDQTWLMGQEQQTLFLTTFKADYHERKFWDVSLDKPHRQNMLNFDNLIYPPDVELLQPGRQVLMVLRNNCVIKNVFPRSDLEDEYPSGYFHIFNVGDDSINGWWPYFTDITNYPENWLEMEEFASLRELIKVTNDDIHTFDVVYSNDMAAQRRAAEGRMVCAEGRFITPADAGQPVCVVSTDFLEMSGLKIGDSITLDLGNYLSEQYAPLGAVAVTRGRQNTEYTTQSFTIIGSWRDLNEGKHVFKDRFWCWSNNAIFVPTAFLPECRNMEGHEFKPSEVSFVIDNAEEIIPFMRECLPIVEEMGLSYVFSDGGWSQIGEDLMQARSIALVKLLVFGGSAIFALVLTVWLFIGRKKREYAIYRALGMPVKGASMQLYIPFLLLGCLSAVVGAVTARVFSLRQLTQADAMTETAMHTPSGPGLYFLGTFGFLLVLAAFAWGGILLIRRKSVLELLQGEGNRRRERTASPERGGRPLCGGEVTSQSASLTAPLSGEPTAAAGRGIAYSAGEPEYGGSRSKNWGGRYLRRLLGRNAGRSLLSLALAALLAFAFGLITVLRGIYAETYRNVEVKGVFSGGISYGRAQNIAESGYVRDPYYERSVDNGMIEMEAASILLVNRLDHQVTEPVEWLEGWDEETAMNTDERILVMYSIHAKRHSVGLGDMVRLNEVDWWQHVINGGLDPLKPGETDMDRRDARRPFFKVVGIIQSNRSDRTVFIPVEANRTLNFMISKFELDIAEYTVADYQQAAEFRKYVQEQLEQSWSTIKFTMDTSYADRIYKIHRLIESLYPLAVAAALLLGGVLPGLIVLHGSKEISILRALGVQARDCVLLYTLSQVLCAMAGLVLGIAMVLVVVRPEIGGVIVPFALYLAAHLAACALGSGVFAWLCARKRVLEQLQAKE
ncbi:MAG: type II toxin-antitoxin system mRNA interferase toxin, RelE/StbE family [Oscillospiraceae bacterium]|nr:type II toxin-antitoxin system mRNA interferase toxin, RelE/StbE family [Oscillospiraceae bacterium]